MFVEQDKSSFRYVKFKMSIRQSSEDANLAFEYLSSGLLRVQIISLRLEIKSISCSVEMTLKALRMDKINKISVSLHRKESQALVPGYFNMKVQKYFEKSGKKKKRNQKTKKQPGSQEEIEKQEGMIF